VCHRTLRCTKRSNSYQRNGRLQRTPANATVRGQFAQKSEQPPEAHRTENSTCPVQHRTENSTCPVQHRTVLCGTGLSSATRRQSSNGQNRQNPNDWVTWLAHRTLSGVPIESSLPQRLFWWVRAINTPQPPPLQQSKHSTLSFQYKIKVQHSKTQIKATDPIKVPNSILVH
jgi:hypothetical protein